MPAPVQQLLGQDAGPHPWQLPPSFVDPHKPVGGMQKSQVLPPAPQLAAVWLPNKTQPFVEEQQPSGQVVASQALDWHCALRQLWPALQATHACPNPPSPPPLQSLLVSFWGSTHAPAESQHPRQLPGPQEEPLWQAPPLGPSAQKPPSHDKHASP
jgi:hypothetical protein